MNKQRKTSHILNVVQYDETGIIGLNGAPVSGYALYLHTNINDGSIGIDSSADINALYLLKNGTKNFEISYDTSGSSKLFRLLPYESGSYFQIGNPSNAGGNYVFISEAIYGNVMIGPGLANGQGNLTGATAATHKIQLNGAVFANSSIQASSFVVTGGASTGFLKANGTIDSSTYATQSYVGTQISNLIDAAPGTLDTLNELAAALGDDANFASTVTTALAGKQASLSGTGFVKISGTTISYDNSTYLTGITSSQVTTALGYTPVTNSRTITINGVGYDLSADRSWSIASGVTSFNTRTGAITLSSADVTTALGYTPYNNTNPSGYITGITSSNVTTALGYTPYNSTNPSGYITSSGTAAAISQTIGANGDTNLVYAAIADNDFFRIRVGGGSNAGWVEIATADDGTEPIYVRQYTGVFSSLTRTATLLDGSGNTSFPGTVTAPTFSGSLSGVSSQVTINYNNDSNSTYQLLWGSGNSVYGTSQVYVNPNSDVIYARGGYISPGNPWSTSDSAFFPNGITTAGSRNWIYGATFIGNAPGNGQGVDIGASGNAYFRSNVGTSSHGSSARFLEIQSANGNFIPYSFESEYGNHSWGTVARFRINQSGADRPSIQFSSASNDTRWNVGYCYADDNFRVTQNMGYRNDNSTTDGWGTERFRINTDGNTYAAIGGTLYANGNTVLHSANYSSYALPLSGGTVTGVAYFLTNNGGYLGSLDSSKLQVYSTSNNSAFMSFHKAGNYAVNFGLDADNVMRIGGWSTSANRWQLDMSGNQTIAGTYYGSGAGLTGTASSLSVGYATNANQAYSFPTSYAGGVQGNPQVYFNQSVGLKVAMTGAWSVWSDTLWVNGYAGGDVPWMCALHFLRNSEPRFAISAQPAYNSGYGSYYEVITTYNIANQTVSTANNLSGFDKTNPSFGAVYASNWFRAQGDCGLYTQDYGGHFRRNTNSYGTWESFGYNKNGWGGISVSNNYVTARMHNSSGDYGFLTENGNWWNLFYNNGNNCWGIGTDNTYSGDGFRCIKYGSAQYGWTTWSDRRAKENISSITGALDTVLAMRGVYFNYIQDEAKSKRVGFIAQELEQVLPEAVRYAEEIDEYSVEYAQIVSVLAEAIKEQNSKITRLEALVEQLTNN